MTAIRGESRAFYWVGGGRYDGDLVSVESRISFVIIYLDPRGPGPGLRSHQPARNNTDGNINLCHGGSFPPHIFGD